MLKKPRLLIDCDGVLCDFNSGALARLHSHIKERYTHDEAPGWDVFDALPQHVQFKDAVFNDMKAEGGCSSLLPYGGAVEGLRRIKDVAEVVVITSPFRGSRTWMYEREKWLEIHFGIPRDNVIFAARKDLIRGDVFVDDKISHVEAWAAANPGKPALLWDQVYNRNAPELQRVTSWDALRTLMWSVT